MRQGLKRLSGQARAWLALPVATVLLAGFAQPAAALPADFWGVVSRRPNSSSA
jgi:hypothetical protein